MAKTKLRARRKTVFRRVSMKVRAALLRAPKTLAGSKAEVKAEVKDELATTEASVKVECPDSPLAAPEVSPDSPVAAPEAGAAALWPQAGVRVAVAMEHLAH